MLHQFSTSAVSFIGEQDGARELRLKEAISVLLDLSATVTRAYLVRASTGGITGGVMLGLVTHDKKDVVFLDDEADALVRESCPPFYHYRARYH